VHLNLGDLETFADAFKAKFALPGSASPEDQLKPAVAELLKDTGTKYGLFVDTRTETHLSEHKVRPDIAIYVGYLSCHAEASNFLQHSESGLWGSCEKR